jgi:adenylate cyclase
VNPTIPAAYLVLEDGSRRYVLNAGQSWAVGRGDGCPVLLDGRSVSRLHALIQRRDDGAYSVVDLGSLNGSFVNNRRVSFPVLLKNGDRVAFGDRRMRFHNPTPLNTEAAPDASTRNDPTTAIHAHTLATILVVDIRGFTPLARQLPEALLSRTVGTWFLKVGQAAQQCGSWAQKYFGDAMMAIWLHEDPLRVSGDLARVLRAVCQIEAATAEVSRELPLPKPLQIGAGLNTGPTIVGASEYTALGDSVNLAFRLQDATKELRSDLAAGDRTYQAMPLPRPPFQPHEMKLKGFESPGPVWAITFDELRAAL